MFFFLSRCLDNPTEHTWKAGKRVLRYLNETKDYRLQFKRQENTDLIAYSDSDWAGDKADRKSTSGSIVYFGGNPVAWFSRKQKCVAKSTAEAKYIAASLTSQELVNLQGIRGNLKKDGKIILYIDNHSAICIISSFENSQRVKHIDIDIHYIKNLVDRKIIKLEYVPSENNFADGFTKSLSKDKFIYFSTNIQVLFE